MEQQPRTYVAFAGNRLVARGPLQDVVLKTKEEMETGIEGRVVIYDETTGYTLDIDFRGTPEEVVARLADHPMVPREPVGKEKRSGPGRPKLGVVSREVSLLPRHWEWLNTQPGGASNALRKLVEEARRTSRAADVARKASEAVYRFLKDMAGDFTGYEEALRSFYAKNYKEFSERIATWPADVRAHALRLVDRLIPLEKEAEEAKRKNEASGRE